MTSLFKCIQQTIRHIGRRQIHATSSAAGRMDLREYRLGHKEQGDKVDGEDLTSFLPQRSEAESFEFVDENLMNRLIDNVKFKDIPVMYIKSSRNNTKVSLHLADTKRLTIRSAGMEGFKNCRKGTTVAAQAVANRVLMVADDHNVKMCRLVFNGLGPGRNAVFRCLEQQNKVKIVSLSDRTQAWEPYIMRPRKAKRI